MCGGRLAAFRTFDSSMGGTRMKKILCVLAALLIILSGCAPVLSETEIAVDVTKTYQTIESFGTSGAWWAQYMGLWDMPYAGKNTLQKLTVREQIASWLYDRNFGIGLTNYRYNLGAGSADSGLGDYSDVHRRAQSFETAPGEYDWSKDEGAQWFLREVTRLGAQEIVLFFNSPPERLTKNGMAHMTPGGEKNNLARENYGEFAKYACDVAEHFLAEGIPVKFISPINEPQWDWTGGQEGCHFEPNEIPDVYVAFRKEMEARPALAGVELSGPESGEWGGQATKYVSALLNKQALEGVFSAVDCHSYWSDRSSKQSFRNWMDARYPDIKLRMSEWCEMVNGSDYTMDSAIVLAKTLAEDLTVLNVVSWATWVGVTPGGYHDGLIYAAEDGQGNVNLAPLKRLWAYGNYTRYIRPGFTRVDTTGGEKFSAVAFRGEEYGEEKLVVVLVNEGTDSADIKLTGDFGAYGHITVYETSAGYDLVKTTERVQNTAFTLTPRSVTTIVFSK